MTAPATHAYTSTACQHAVLDDRPELHQACRNSCKFCPGACGCPCHNAAGTQPAVSWVDQARDIARRLYAEIDKGALGVVAPELALQILNDPALFWLRGEEMPPGEWASPASPSTPREEDT